MAKDRTKDLTQGTPWKVIAGFSLPVIGGNLFQLFYTLADSMIVGRTLGADALAAVGATATIVYFVLCFIQGLTGGCGILLGQAFGAGNEKQVRESVSASVWISALFTIVLTVLCCSMVHPILRMLNTPVDIYDRTYTYLFIIFLGNGATVFYNMIFNILRALGDSRTPLYFLIFSSVLNVVLDVVFIKFLGMGVEGCAYATVIAQAVSAVCCMVYIIKKYPILHLEKKNFAFRRGSFAKLLNLGIPMALQFSITAIGTIIVQGAVNVYGAVYMAGFSAAGKIQNIITMVAVSIGATIATYVGQNRGAGRMDRVRAGVKYSWIMLLIWAVIEMVVMYFGGRYFTYLFIDPSETAVVEVSVTYFRTVFWAYPFLCTIFLFRNALQGMGYGLVPMLGGVFELVARATIVLLVAGRTSFAGVCLADPTAWIAALIPLIPYYYYVMKKYKKQTVAPLSSID